MDPPQESEGGDAEFVGSKGVVKKNEFVRMIADALYTLGYVGTGKQLEDESGISLQSREAVGLFKQQIRDGRWDKSLALLRQIGLKDEISMKLAIFIIKEAKFVELVLQNKRMAAWYTIKNEILPLGVNVHKVGTLYSWFLLFPNQKLFPSREDARRVYYKGILELLQSLAPPSVVFLDNRLEHLVEQGITQELSHDIGKMPLPTRQDSGTNNIPDRTGQVLPRLRGEVLRLKFSHNGRYLASASSDFRVIIWEVRVNEELSLERVLESHVRTVVDIRWSYDDNQLLTCGEEELVSVWDVASGSCRHRFKAHDGTRPGLGVVSCDWGPDGKSIYLLDNYRRIGLWNPERREVMVVGTLPGGRSKKIGSLYITSQKELITIWEERGIVLHRLPTNSLRFIEENQPIFSCTLSQDNKSLLVSLRDGRLRLWDIASPICSFLTEFSGLQRPRFFPGFCFGGVNERFNASGSEDSQVYIWHRSSSTPICKLRGHVGAVNCVSWNPVYPGMLASGGDDRTIRMWRLGPWQA